MFSSSHPAEDTVRVLRANIGMNFTEVKQESTLDVVDSTSGFLGGRLAVGQSRFAFEVPGSRLHFENCRYYWMETNDCGDPRLRMIHVGVSGRRITQKELGAAVAQIQEQLTADGWEAGADSNHWAKEGTVISIDCTRLEDRLDEIVPQYMVALKLLPRESYPSAKSRKRA